MLVLFSHDLYGSKIDRNLWCGKFVGVADIFYCGYLLVRWRLWCSMAQRWDYPDPGSFDYEAKETHFL